MVRDYQRKYILLPVTTACCSISAEAHAPYFTRNIVILTDSEGNTGVGEVPGGPKITTALENVSDIVVGDESLGLPQYAS